MDELPSVARSPTRDDDAYWQLGKPADHNGRGLFVDGPQPAVPAIVQLLPPSPEPLSRPSPQAARAEMALRRLRALEIVARRDRFLAALRRA